MEDRAIEGNALLLLWTTLRNNLQPELSSALARDRAKRADAAMVRLIAGCDRLSGVRAGFESRYSQLLDEAKALSNSDQPALLAANATEHALEDNIAFVGVPSIAGHLENLLVSLADAAGSNDQQFPFDTLLARVVGLEAELRGAYESAVGTVTPVTVRATQAVTDATLERYLQAHPKGSPEITVRSVNDIPGGRSKRTIVVELERNGPLPPAIVLRMDTGRGVGTNVADEYPLLERVAERGLPVPEPLWLESSGEPFGFPFIVFRRMPGASAGDLIEGAFNKVPETGRSLARTLGTIHAAGNDLIEDPQMRGSSVPHTHDLLNYYYDWWTSKKPFPSLIIESAFIWLKRNIDAGLGQATIVHADTGFHNLLMDDQGNACMVDWEFAHFGDGAEDLASTRPAVESFMPWEDFLAEYHAHGGMTVTEFQLNYFEIWRPLRNAVVCGTVLHSMIHGEADDIDPVTIGLSTFQRLQADLANSLAAIIGSSNAAAK